MRQFLYGATNDLLRTVVLCPERKMASANNELEEESYYCPRNVVHSTEKHQNKVWYKGLS